MHHALPLLVVGSDAGTVLSLYRRERCSVSIWAGKFVQSPPSPVASCSSKDFRQQDGLSRYPMVRSRRPSKATFLLTLWPCISSNGLIPRPLSSHVNLCFTFWPCSEGTPPWDLVLRLPRTEQCHSESLGASQHTHQNSEWHAVTPARSHDYLLSYQSTM
jgi:hypothetical protein